MISRRHAEKKEQKLSSEYEELKRRIDDSIKRDEARQRILRRKRDERRDIKKGGGGKEIARKILGGKRMGSSDTDFRFGANVDDGESIDERIAREQAERCMGKVYCPECKTYHGYCAEIKEEREKLKMLPTGDERSSSRSNNQSGISWLKPEKLSTAAKEAKILAVHYNEKGRFGARVELKLALDGEIIYWGIDPKKNSENPNYKDLTAKFGHDENNWIDQRILLYVEEHKFYQGRFNIRVDFPKVKGRQA